MDLAPICSPTVEIAFTKVCDLINSYHDEKVNKIVRESIRSRTNSMDENNMAIPIQPIATSGAVEASAAAPRATLTTPQQATATENYKDEN